MSEIVTLRTLTKKSKLKYGKFPNATVQEVIDSGRAVYLIWLYYNVQWMTFTDEILDELKVFPSNRIQKPAIAPEMFDKRMGVIRRLKYGDKAGFIRYWENKKKAKRTCEKMETMTDFTPAQQQAMNHGHVRFKEYSYKNKPKNYDNRTDC